ncbi:hypothetical protein MMC07_007171 [Pseudocyphellaria aurata]|nr:hypothetical protein [Pseudocyphellaria aurata]
MPQDFDLNLTSLWYTKNPPAFPVPSMTAKGPCVSTYTWSWEQDFTGTRKTLICAVRWTDTLAVTRVHVRWHDSDPLGTVESNQMHIPPPAPPSEQDLLDAHQAYGANVAAWAAAAVGSTVGDGECWTLIHTALLDLADTYRRHGQEPPRIPQGRDHGHRILALDAAAPGSCAGLLHLADVRAGDILEIKSAHFRIVEDAPPPSAPTPPSAPAPAPAPGTEQWKQGPREKNIRMTHHSAIISRVSGDVISVIEQNGSVPLGVGLESYNLAQMDCGLE